MKTTKALFFALIYDFQSERWNEFELPKLSLRELLGLAKLLGCPSCGSKETVIVRLLAQRELRLKLARFTDNPEELAISYKRESLRDMCREARIWRSGNKRALSAGLLNWRDRYRERGQAFLAEMRSLAKNRRSSSLSASEFWTALFFKWAAGPPSSRIPARLHRPENSGSLG
jgi:hypothetical protein